ncbi:hypothetical protein OE88DRAFT_602967 [Heliocybe sulcata]|uniref:Uncharacterized protein n=1 Tax=Heliocybe sulcata TaxID=5364 RepID=A0A5C3MRU4_9AGAM|nr:hypothetical protein OE88DRAFT_602967 [Heliocybe sulcata]
MIRGHTTESQATRPASRTSAQLNAHVTLTATDNRTTDGINFAADADLSVVAKDFRKVKEVETERLETYTAAKEQLEESEHSTTEWGDNWDAIAKSGSSDVDDATACDEQTGDERRCAKWKGNSHTSSPYCQSASRYACSCALRRVRPDPDFKAHMDGGQAAPTDVHDLHSLHVLLAAHASPRLVASAKNSPEPFLTTPRRYRDTQGLGLFIVLCMLNAARTQASIAFSKLY